MIGRQLALERIVSLTSRGEENAIVVRGESGIGRTRLLEAVLSAHPGRALLVRANPAETAFSLSGLSMVFASIGDVRLAEFIGRFSLSSTSPEDLFVAAGDLLTVLRGLNLDPVVVLIDDVDLMDTESQSILGYMSTRLTSTNICLVVSVETAAIETPLVDDPTAYSPFSGAPTITLERLSTEDTEAVFAEVADGPIDASTRLIVGEYVNGLPLAAVEVVRGLSDSEVSGQSALTIPFRIGMRTHQLTERQLAGVPHATLALLELLSCAPSTTPEALFDDTDDTDDTDNEDHIAAASDLLDDLLAARLVVREFGRISIADPFIRSGLYWGLTSSRRRDLHRTMAVRSREIDPPLAAWHESWASSHGSAAQQLLDSAAGLAAEGHTRAAVEFAERALSAQSQTPPLIDALTRLAAALVTQGRLALALRYFAAALALHPDGRQDLVLARLMVFTEFLQNERLRADEIEARISNAPGEFANEEESLLLATAIVHAERGETAEAKDLISQLSTRTHHDAPESRWARALIRALSGTADPLAELQAIDRDAEIARARFTGQLLAARALSFSEKHVEARKAFVTIIVKDVEAGRTRVECARIFAAENDIRSGNYDQALGFIRNLESDSEVLRVRRRLLQIWSLEVQGHHDDAIPLIADCESLLDHDHSPVLAARLYSIWGTSDLMRGDTEAALDHFHRVRSMAKLLTLPLHSRHNADLIEATVASGSLREANTLMLEFDELRARMPARWSTLASARARAILAPDDRAIAQFEDSLGLFTPDDSPYEYGRMLLAYAARLDLLSRPDEAYNARSRAHGVFESISASGWIHESIRPHRVPEPPPTRAAITQLADLTPSELEILHLLQRGQRNKEIASRLFVSLRTVEVRLTRIYRKTGTQSRSHLLAILAHEEPVSDTVTNAPAVRAELRGPA